MKTSSLTQNIVLRLIMTNQIGTLQNRNAWMMELLLLVSKTLRREISGVQNAKDAGLDMLGMMVHKKYNIWSFTQSS